MAKRTRWIGTLARAGMALALLMANQACARAPADAPREAQAGQAAGAAANDNARVHPALWVVKDADTTIYLFGTIHVLKPGIAWFDGPVKRAFDSSDQLMLEIVQPGPEAMTALFQKLGVNPTGPSLTEKLPEADRAKLAAALARLDLPATALDRYDPWVAAINLAVLPLLKLGYDPQNGPERVLTDAAKAERKPVAGLETPEEQLGYFDSLSQGAQIKFLESTLDEMPAVADSIRTMINAWSAGQPDALAKELNEGLDDQPEIAKALLIDRNARWAAWIETRMKQPGVVFIAVGAGHLAGPASVQAMLARHGLKAVRIRY